MARPHVVILGAGFGGVYVAKKLLRAVRRGEIDVTIVNRTNYFLFTPLLHEVATGSLNPRSVSEPLREIFVGTKVRIVQGTVNGINTAKRTVEVKSNSTTITLIYDRLLVATGAETNYYGIPGAAEHCLPLKSTRDASIIRNRVIDAFEEAVLTEDPARRRELLSFVIVGGGPTGVELCAEMAEFIEGMVRRYYGKTHCRPGDPRHCEAEEPTITLVNATKDLLEMFAPSLRAHARKHLAKMGVDVRLETTVTEVTKNEIVFSNGVRIPTTTVMWAAGVKAAVPRFEDTQPTLSGGRLAVDNYFRILNHDDIYAMGDTAAYFDSHGPKVNARPLPQLAQVAEGQADTVAQNILSSFTDKKLLHDFHYHSKGSMVSVGQWFAIGEIYSMDIAGWFTWWMWRTVYLSKFASWRKRVHIGIEWFLQMFMARDITKIS